MSAQDDHAWHWMSLPRPGVIKQYKTLTQALLGLWTIRNAQWDQQHIF